MSDRHMRILRQMARQTRRQLEQHDTINHAEAAASDDQREFLNDAVKRTRGQVADAEQRRRSPSDALKRPPARTPS